MYLRRFLVKNALTVSTLDMVLAPLLGPAVALPCVQGSLPALDDTLARGALARLMEQVDLAHREPDALPRLGARVAVHLERLPPLLPEHDGVHLALHSPPEGGRRGARDHLTVHGSAARPDGRLVERSGQCDLATAVAVPPAPVLPVPVFRRGAVTAILR